MFIVVELFKWYPNQIDNAIKLGDSRESCVKAFSRNTGFFSQNANRFHTLKPSD